jgi:hypothetical protein
MIHHAPAGYQGGQVTCGASAENLTTSDDVRKVTCKPCRNALKAQRTHKAKDQPPVPASAPPAPPSQPEPLPEPKPEPEPDGSVVAILDKSAPEPPNPGDKAPLTQGSNPGVKNAVEPPKKAAPAPPVKKKQKPAPPPRHTRKG